MGNLQQQCRGVADNRLELDRPQAIYATDEAISGTVSYLKHANASVLLTGIISFKKRKRNGLEKCQIQFLSMESRLSPSSEKKQNFQFHLDDHLPPSFHDLDAYPNISYSINLLYKKSKDRIHASLPIRVCPRTHIDRPLLLTPLFFGPVENHLTGVKLEVKVNRAVFTPDDIIQIYYELQNPNQHSIQKMEVSLGVYYLIESNVWQEDICNGMEVFSNLSATNKLIRNKALLNIPNKIYLPPTYEFRYGREGTASSFHLSIEYKIQLKISLEESEGLWQVDIPIVLSNEKLEGIETIGEEIDVNKVEGSSGDFDTNVDITE